MTKVDYKKYIPRLKELSEHHLNCALDDNEPNFIPADLIEAEGSYRWFLYIYSNLYKPGDDTISVGDRNMFVTLFTMFKTEHLINWTRDKLIPFDKQFIQQIKMKVIENINRTESFFELRVNLYTLRCLSEGWYYTDSHVLGISNNLKEFTIE